MHMTSMHISYDLFGNDVRDLRDFYLKMIKGGHNIWTRKNQSRNHFQSTSCNLRHYYLGHHDSGYIFLSKNIQKIQTNFWKNWWLNVYDDYVFLTLPHHKTLFYVILLLQHSAVPQLHCKSVVIFASECTEQFFTFSKAWLRTQHL